MKTDRPFIHHQIGNLAAKEFEIREVRPTGEVEQREAVREWARLYLHSQYSSPVSILSGT
jgi:hypothetical protein